MTRSASRRHGVMSAEKTPPLPPASEPRPDDPQSAPHAAAVPWYWRLVLFVWAASFVSLLLYEWLSGLLKWLVRSGGAS